MVYDRQRTKRSFDCEKKIAAFEWSVMYEHGSPRIHAVLQFRGIACSKNTVAKLMREAGIRAKAARKYRCTTDSNHSLPVAENLVQREFLPDAPNLIWAGDITEIPTREGKLYLAVILDLYSRLVVGWSVGSTMETELAVAAFRMASRRRRITRELILHSDRGSASILARVSNRNRMSPDGRNVDIGVRPAGAID
jgi:transposase InsO family protein